MQAIVADGGKWTKYLTRLPAMLVILLVVVLVASPSCSVLADGSTDAYEVPIPPLAAVSTATPTVMPTSVPDVLFEDDFQNEEVTLSQWTLSGEWQIIDGSYACVANGSSLAGDVSWQDYTLYADVKGVEVVDKVIHFRYVDEETAYGIDLRSHPYNDLVLTKSTPGQFGQHLRFGSVTNYNGNWYSIKISAVGNAIQVFVDDNLIINYVDSSSPVLNGQIGVGAMLQASPDSAVHFDSVRVVSIASADIPISPPVSTPTPATTPTIVSDASDNNDGGFPFPILAVALGASLVAGGAGAYVWRRRKKSFLSSTRITATEKVPFPQELQSLYANMTFIGAGGFAKVYRATRRSDGKEVAVKVPERLDAHTGDIFLSEVSSWQRLKHRNIAELYARNIYPTPYLEREFCPDGLDGLPKPMDAERAAGTMFDIAEGLKYAHSQGVIHRDLKPHNILLKDEVPKIVDWGLSKVVAESKGSSRGEGHTFSLYWAAPEQLAREKFGSPDHRTDIYQLGVIFYELMTGGLPFKGDGITEIMGAILTEEARLPSSVNPDVAPVDAIILKCLRKQMNDRYQSVDELQRDLADYLKLEYKESLKKSQGDMKRSGYYCAELCLVHLRMGDVKEALKFAADLSHYASEQVKADLAGLITELEYRSKEGVGITEELMERAAIVLHQARMGR